MCSEKRSKAQAASLGRLALGSKKTSHGIFTRQMGLPSVVLQLVFTMPPLENSSACMASS
jgi:hypothetical protein